MQLKANAKQYEQLNVPIIVIVGQKKESVSTWLAENPMPFPFLVDEDRTVIKAFNVYHRFGLDAYKIAHPSLFLIAEDGTIVYSYVGKNQADRPTNDQTYEQVHALISE